MEDNTLDQSLHSQLNKRHRRKGFLRLMAVALLLSLGLSAYLALNYLVPMGPGRTRGVTARVNWYLQSGQSQADLHTLASVFRFILGTDSDAGPVDNDSTISVAENASPSSPKS
jgi:hypothetical protein